MEDLQELEWLGLSDDIIARRNLFDYTCAGKIILAKQLRISVGNVMWPYAWLVVITDFILNWCWSNLNMLVDKW
jgi:hypothetical protein